MKKIFLILLALFLISCSAKKDEPTASSSTNTSTQGEQPVGPDGKPVWTILLYMNGDETKLSSYVDGDLAEMAQINLGVNVNLIALYDKRGTGARFVKVNYRSSYNSEYLQDLSGTINGKNFGPGLKPEIDMLDPNTLKDFLSKGKELYPAEHYAVILWSHGDGWRSSTTRGLAVDQDSGKESMTNKQIASALSNQNLDAIGFDACLEGSLETLWELKKNDVASIVVASPHLIPGSGWDYASFLNQFKNSNRTINDFAQVAVASYQKNYSNFTSWTVSLNAYDLRNFDTQKIKDFFIWLKATDFQTELSNLSYSKTTLALYLYKGKLERQTKMYDYSGGNCYFNTCYYDKEKQMNYYFYSDERELVSEYEEQYHDKSPIGYVEIIYHKSDYVYYFTPTEELEVHLGVDLYDFISKSNYSTKSELLSMLDDVTIYGWSSGSAKNNYSGLGVYLQFHKTSWKFDNYIEEYKRTSFSLDTEWDEIVSDWNSQYFN